MLRPPRWAVALTFVLALAYLAISWVFADKLIGQTFASETNFVFSDFGLPEPETVTIESGSGRLAGWFFENPEGGDCAVILQHGYTSNKGAVLVSAPLFWERGCHLLSYDLRSHGESSAGLLTYGVHDKDDQSAAIDWLVERTGLAPDRIGLMGWSYGAATSLQTAAAREEVAFVIADASYSDLPAIASRQATELFGAWTAPFVPGALLIAGLRAGFDPRDASPRDAVVDLGIPVLLVHSTTDDFTPAAHSEAIYASADPATTRLALTEWGAPHAMSYATDPLAYARIVDAFLDDLVPGFGSSSG